MKGLTLIRIKFKSCSNKNAVFDDIAPTVEISWVDISIVILEYIKFFLLSTINPRLRGICNYNFDKFIEKEFKSNCNK